MLRSLRSKTILGITAAVMIMAVGGAGTAAIAAEYDAPSFSLISVDRSSARVMVTAGASGAPGGFVIEWMTHADYIALGGWPADVYGGSVLRCECYGTPSLTTTAGVDDYLLEPNQSILVEIGDLFDETGLAADDVEELTPGGQYWIRVQASTFNGVDASAYSTDIFLEVQEQTGADCTFTQGYWKNHPGAWPVAGLDLGNCPYTAAELLSIYQTPAAGNGLLIVAHQLIAAKLNIANGANADAVQSAIDAADALIGDLKIPPVGGGDLAPKNVSDLTETIDQYNNGQLDTPHCDVVQVEPSTWGNIKGQYR